jgi:hypothetical protein
MTNQHIFHAYNEYLQAIANGNLKQRYVYMIRAKVQGQWLFRSIRHIGDIGDAVIWTRNKSVAHVFFDEETVEEFKFKYISPRKAEIIRI